MLNCIMKDVCVGGYYFVEKYLCEECASGLMLMGCCAQYYGVCSCLCDCGELYM